MPATKIENITKDYKIGKISVPALRDVSLEIQEGEFLSIAGPSGSGKSTLLNMIGCLDTPTSGKVYVADKNISNMSSKQLADIRNQYLGFIFQTFNLIPVLTAFENVEFPLVLLKIKDAEERKKEVMTMLEAVKIADLAHRKPSEMSGGQQQRVAIARALVKVPKLVLADEPTANLDSVTGEDILKLMQELNKTTKTTFIFSTHDPMVMDYARRLVKLHDGKIQEDITK